ncbi:MAG: helix-turn-helix domain-containing protein [Treponema sp.]|nr:helix-turn-helix domain-containing protein [Treponema sp.]
MTVNERVKQLRTSLKMSQTEFGRAIFLSNGYIADMELGKKKVNDRIIHLISLTFGVSEVWLKDGTGSMFFTTPAEKLQRLTSLFNELPPRFQDYVVTQIEQLLAAIDGESESGNSEATGGSTGQ